MAPMDCRSRNEDFADQASKIDVLDLVLHYAKEQLDQRAIFALLSTSKAAAAVTARHLTGQLHLVFQPKSVQRAEEFASWLATNADLLQSLEVLDMIPGDASCKPASSSKQVRPANTNKDSGQDKARCITAEGYRAGSFLARSFAAIGAYQLQRLRSFVCNDCSMVVGPLVQSLPAALTQLELSCSTDVKYYEKLYQSSRGTLGACLEQGLARMTGFPVTPEHCILLPQGLVHLDCPSLDDVDGACDLGHLTALTTLVSPDRNWGTVDVLPPNIEVINLPIHDVELLRPLKHLRRVETWLWAEDAVDLASYPCAVSGALTHVWAQHSVDPDEEEDIEDDAGQDMPDGGVGDLVEDLVSSGAVKFLRELHLIAFHRRKQVWGLPLVQPLSALTSLTKLGLELRLTVQAAKYLTKLGLL